MAEEKSMPFGLSWEVIVMLIVMAVFFIVVFGNPQFIERMLSFIKGSF